MKGEREVSHMKNKTFILLVAVICLTLATLLIAKTSDGQTAYAKIFVHHIPQTTTTACSREIIAP